MQAKVKIGDYFLRDIRQHLSHLISRVGPHRSTFEDIIRQIDGLTEWQIHQGVHLRLPGKLQAATSNLNEFERLDRLMEQDFKDLEPALQRAAR